MDQKIGHLAIFVSSKVGAKQDEEFVQLMDVIDCMPPGCSRWSFRRVRPVRL